MSDKATALRRHRFNNMEPLTNNELDTLLKETSRIAYEATQKVGLYSRLTELERLSIRLLLAGRTGIKKNSAAHGMWAQRHLERKEQRGGGRNGD